MKIKRYVGSAVRFIRRRHFRIFHTPFRAIEGSDARRLYYDPQSENTAAGRSDKALNARLRTEQGQKHE